MVKLVCNKIWLIAFAILIECPWVFSQADLIGRITYLSHEGMYAGEMVVAHSEISNVGSQATEQGKTLIAHYYLSQDAQWDSLDIYVGDNQINSPLAAGNYFEDIIRIFNIPEDVLPGNYHLLYVMDPENTCVEANEANNIDVYFPIRIKTLLKDGAELTGLISNIESKKLHPGERVSARSYLKNVGTLPSHQDDAGFFTLYMLCPDTSWCGDQSIRLGGEYFGDPIPPGREIYLDETLTIPADLSIGTYSIWFVVDPDQAILEVDEENNLRLYSVVTVEIYWWKSWWAYLMYICLIAYISYFIFMSIRVRQKARRAMRETAQTTRDRAV